MRPRYPLTNEQLELLLVFEAADGSLSRLAEAVRRDPSVVSRNLQRLAEDAPVLAKRGTKWHITALGQRLNDLTRRHIGELGQALATASDDSVEPFRGPSAVLMIVNAQQALLDPKRGTPSNASAQANAGRLLHHWRATRRPVVHVKHQSAEPSSAYHPSQPTSEFLPALAPLSGEWVIEKPGISAFTNAALAEGLERRQAEALVVVGFTANACVDATAKQSSDLGFKTYVVADATSMFDLVGPDGKIHPGERSHEILLASLHSGFAAVLTTDQVLHVQS
jgi:nicotinamidase-related amidase